jgi:hypothetical protein
MRAEQLQHAPVRLGAPTVIEGEGVTHGYRDVTYPDQPTTGGMMGGGAHHARAATTAPAGTAG